MTGTIHSFAPGNIIHGFAHGAFGRDSYDCRRVEAVGADWIVTRNTNGEVELCAGAALAALDFNDGTSSYCANLCSLPGAATDPDKE